MKKLILMTMTAAAICLTACGAPKEEATVVQTYEVVTDDAAAKKMMEDCQPVTMVQYFEMSDGTWKTGEYTYKHRLELRGRMPNAAMDSVFIVLSNRDDITFDQAGRSLYSSNSADQFNPAETVLVALG